MQHINRILKKVQLGKEIIISHEVGKRGSAKQDNLSMLDFLRYSNEHLGIRNVHLHITCSNSQMENTILNR